MTEAEMTSALVWGAAGWAAFVAFFLALIFVLSRGPKVTPLPDPAFRDRPSVADLELALEHDALIEDVEIAWLDSIYELPTREPLR